VNSVTGIVFCSSLVVSPGGHHVYAIGSIDKALAVFDRDPATGALTFVEADVRAPDLFPVNTVVQSPDGMHLYATADAVTVFRLTAAPATTSTSTSTTTTSTSATTSTSTSTSTLTTSPSTSTTTPSGSTTTTTLPGCGPSPLAGCKQPRASRLRLHAGAARAKDSLAWFWTRGAATRADFGDPTTATDYRLCVYDHADTTPALVLEAAVPAGGACDGKPCWRHRRAGFRFKSKDLAGDGVAQIDLAPGREGKAAIAVKGRGANLPSPALPLTLPVRVQLRASNGSCWEASPTMVGKGAAR
jgi:hypothetical protein